MSKFIVMDIVFYAGSLNYDQGSGNYQELKKITKWDGKQYTFVSRYALRYSLLETGRKLGLWNLAEGKELMPEENQKVIQPSEDLLLSGRILDYPEFDLFGYLLTSTQPQNFREAPVKISHAISMTPFNYDALFNANIGLANRLRKTHGEMSPNPFTAEEHYTYYQYSIIVDVERVGNLEVFLSPEYKKSNKTNKLTSFDIEKNDDKFVFKIKYGNLKTIEFSMPVGKNYLEKLYIPLEKDKVSYPEEIENKLKFDKDLGVVIFKYKYPEVGTRIHRLISAIINFNRCIKARDEDLSPKLLILGLYKDKPYKTYKDKIVLKDEYMEEEYDEVIEKDENGKIIRKVVHRVSKSKKPVFEIYASDIPKIEKEGIWVKIKDELLNPSKEKLEKVYLFQEPEVESKILNNQEE